MRVKTGLLGAAFVALLGSGLAACSSDSTDSSDEPGAGSSDAGADTASNDAGSDTVASGLSLTFSETPPTTAEAGTTLSLSVLVERDGAPAQLTLTGTVEAGGGSVVAGESDANGLVTVSWTLGGSPVAQRLLLEAESQTLTLTVDTTLTTPHGSTAFGGVVDFFETNGGEGSTEDLVIQEDGILMGAPGGLIRVGTDGAVQQVALTGTPITRGWGIAADSAGTLWVVDSGEQVLVKVDGGDAEVVVTEVDGASFDGLNDVEVGPGGDVFATDPCTARLFRYSPTEKSVTGSHTFDLATQGGPNGMAFDRDGRLFVSTENTVVLCGHSDVAAYDAPLAGVYRFDVTDEGFSEPETIATEVAVFGDGLTFDDDGNLYGIFDTLEGLGLDESAVLVFPGGMAPARKVVVADGVLYANLAFGTGEFGNTTLYLALLKIAGLTADESLGLHRIELGIPGASWR